MPFTPIYKNDLRIQANNSWFIKTDSLKHRVLPKVKRRFLHPCFLADGDWDKELENSTNSGTYKRLSLLYNDGKKYDKSGFFDLMNKYNQKGKPFNFNGLILDNDDKINFYVDYCVDIFESMRTIGFDNKKCRSGIGVAVTRERALVKTSNGRHRLAIAQLLKTPKIFIQITNVHSDLLVNEKQNIKNVLTLLLKLQTETEVL